MCFVHELGFAEMPKAYAFRGTKSVTAQQVHRGARSKVFFFPSQTERGVA